MDWWVLAEKLLPGVGVSLASLCLRWIYPVAPQPVAWAGVVIGAGLLVRSLLPPHPLIWDAAIPLVALAVGAGVWRMDERRKKSELMNSARAADAPASGSDQQAAPSPAQGGPIFYIYRSVFKNALPHNAQLATVVGSVITEDPAAPKTISPGLLAGSELTGVNLKPPERSIISSNRMRGDGASTFEYDGDGSAFVENEVTDYQHVKIRNRQGITRGNKIARGSEQAPPSDPESDDGAS